MRPVRLTGVDGTSQWVPLDAYSPAPATAYLETAGAPTLEITLDNPFEANPAPAEIELTANADGYYELPPGTRAVRGVGMVVADVLHVSQQGIA